ncbi:39S ribosomal protein L43, mitochondrial [Copidosoma floridanum]|uniref:39S ribosomal protein L43, mitochondrial n=1 Tax=Copidosoma floridanum TaxID=29053 RepID=UPI0006C9AB0C|nr:39S ribosomal protein L43, mitochondrial [Copidosoma floridanum]
MSYSQLGMKSGFVRANICNGIGRYIGQLQRVTIKFCKNHGSSRGVRDFIEHDVINYAKENPGVAVYVKPRRHRAPIIKAEYLGGDVHWIPCQGFSHENIIKYMELVKTQSKNGSDIRLRKFWHTEFPSIQGPWTPFTFRNPKLNITEISSDEFRTCNKTGETASEEIVKLFIEQQLNDKTAKKLPKQTAQN